MRIAKIELYREDLTFSAGHFTIFSATHREKLHGHNYLISLTLMIEIEKHGIRVDYRHYHQKVLALCRNLNLHFLLPMHSQFLKIEDKGDYYHAHFNKQIIPFLKDDVILLPIENTTIEDLSNWFLQQLIADTADLEKNGIQEMTVKVASNVGRSGSTTWTKS